MSLAKVVSVTKARKDQGHCGKCKRKLVKGEGYVHFTVGYRGVTQRRCTDTACWPTPSERESSRTADVYAAQEAAEEEMAKADSLEAVKAVLESVAEAADEVAEEYEQNEMFERNEDLQQRAETLREAAQEYRDWEPDEEEPTEDDDESWTKYDDNFKDAYITWLFETKDQARECINQTELP